MTESITSKGQGITRRRVLTLGGSGLVAGVAGCSIRTDTVGGELETETLSPAPVGESKYLKLTSLNYPQTVELQKPFRYLFTVKNTDSRDQSRFETAIRTTTLETGERSVERVAVKIPPGEQHTVEMTHPPFRYLGRREIQIDAFDRTFSVEGVRMTRSLGELTFEEGWTLPDDLKVGVDELALADAPTTAENTQWAFAAVTVWLRRSGTPTSAPPPETFTMQTPSEQYEPSTPPDELVPPPLEVAVEQYHDRRLQPWNFITGWLAYNIPTGRSIADLRMRWERTYDEGTVAVEWGPV